MLHLEHRTAKMEDIPLLVDLRIEFAESIHGSLPEIRRQEIRGSVEQYFAKTIPQLEYLCILCFHRQELAGMGAMVLRRQPGGAKNPSGRIGYLANMYTRPAFRRQGICNAIIHMLIEHGKSEGLHVFELQLHKTITISMHILLHCNATTYPICGARKQNYNSFLSR